MSEWDDAVSATMGAAAPVSPALDAQPPGAATAPGQAPSQAPDWDAAVAASIQPQATPARAGYLAAQGTNPDQYAAAQDLARRLGVPVQTAMGAEGEGLKRKLAMGEIDFDKIAREQPATNNRLANPDQAKLMHDDVHTLTGVEQAVQPTKGLLADIAGMPMEFARGSGGATTRAAAALNTVLGAFPVVADATANLFGAKTTAAEDWWFSNMVAPTVARQPLFAPAPDAGFLGKAANTAGSLLGVLSQIVLSGGGGAAVPLSGTAAAGIVPAAEATAADVIAGAVAHGSKAMLFPALTDAVNTAREVHGATGDPWAAARAAQVQYLATTGMGVLPMSVPGGLVKRMASGALSGMTAGEASRAAMNLALPVQMQQPFTGEGLALSALAGSVLALGGPRGEVKGYQDAVRRTYTAAAKAQQAQADAARLGTLGQLSAASKYRERDPAAFHQFVQDAGEGGGLKEVYVDVATLGEVLHQAGVDRAALAAKLPDLEAQIHEAEQTAGMVRIPVADYATHIAGGPVDAALLPHLRTDPDGMTFSEATAFHQGQVELFTREADRVLAQHESDTAWKTSSNEVRDHIAEQLTATGRFTADVVRVYADLHQAFFEVLADRMRTTPDAAYAQFGARIVAESLGGRGLHQPEGESATAPEQPRVGPFGPILTEHVHDAQGAVAKLMEMKTGEAVGALHHPEIGDIDLVWGQEGTGHHDGYGLSKIVAWHPEVVNNLQSIISGMRVTKRSANRAQLESESHQGAVRLQWDGQSKHWLLTAFEKGKEGDGSGAEPRTDTPGTGKKGDSLSLAPASIVEQQISKFYQKTGAPRGAYDPATRTIALLKDADLTTFTHESGHFFLDTYAKLAALADAPAGVRADVDALLRWFGIEGAPELSALDAWHLMDLDAQRAHHETFARGFEQYLFEGKAPSVELNGVFGRIRSWMVRVYQRLEALGAPLTAEVRQVFGRMLASEDAIKTAEHARGYAELFRTPEDAARLGIDPAEYRAYQEQGREATADAVGDLQARAVRDLRWLTNARNKALAQVQREARGLRQAAQMDARREVMSQPVYRAWQFLTSKLGVDDKLPSAERPKSDPKTLDPAALNAGRLDEGALHEVLVESAATPEDGARIAARLAAEKMIGTGGMHPDIVADLYGFDSGSDLVRALADAAPPKAAIEAATDRLMLERHGDVATPQAMARAAEEAIHSDARARVMATGMKLLGKLAGPAREIARAAKEAAEAAIGAKRVRDLRPLQYTAAEGKAGRALLKAIEKGDIPRAAQLQRAQLLNNRLARAAGEASKEVGGLLAQWGRFSRRADDRLKGSYDMDLVNAVRSILGQYGVAPIQAKKAGEYLGVLEREDPDTYATVAAAVQRAEAGAKPFQQMTVDEVRGLAADVDALLHLARRSRQVETDAGRMALDRVKDHLVGRLEDIGIPDRVPGEGHAVTPGEERMAQFRTALAWVTRAEAWVGRMDGAQAMGPFRRFLFNRIKDGADAYRRDKGIYLKEYRDLLDRVAPTLTGGKIAAPELGYRFGEAQKNSAIPEILHAILHTGNESNARKLLLGRGWGEERPDGTLDRSRWDAFIARMIAEGKITKDHFDFAQGVWDLLERLKPAAQQAHRDAYGRYFAEVTADPVATPFGEYRGGYVPAKTDPRVVKDAALRELLDKENAGMAYAFPATSKGFTKGRVEYNKPLLLDLRSLAQHIDQVLLFSHLDNPVRDTQRIIRAIGGPLERVQPGVVSGMLIPWLNRTAKQQVVTPVSHDAGMSRFFTVLRSRAGAAAMFGNISNALQQVSGFGLAALKVPPGHLLSAMVDYAKHPRKLAAAVADASIYMKDRLDSDTMSMSDDIRQILMNPSVLARAQDWTLRHAYFMQLAVDSVMSPVVWTGAYNHAIAKSMSHADAVRLADSAVRETQGSFLPEDVSRIEAVNAFTRLFTQFAGYFNTWANLLGTEFSKVTHEAGLAQQYQRGFYVFMVGYLAPAVVAELVTQVFRGGPHDNNDDGSYLDDWLRQLFVIGPVRSATAMIPIGGSAINAGVNTWNSKPYDDRIATSPAISMIEATVRAPVSAYDAIVNGKSGQKAIRDVATLISLTIGVPLTLPARPVGYLADVAGGKIRPSGPVDLARGVVTGIASPGSKD